MTQARYTYVFSLTGKDQEEMVAAKNKFKTIDIIRLGIKTALKSISDDKVAQCSLKNNH
jgi:hypothetical protein